MGFLKILQKKELEAEFRHVQKMDTIGTLASGIAHDFNNSLGGIIGAISIIERNLRGGSSMSVEKELEYLTLMKESGEKGVSMVRKLLSLARKSEYELTPVNINDIVKRVVELLAGVIDKSISVFPVYMKIKLLPWLIGSN
jgi:nitrogen-specific signal transduction histidine kinase